MFSGSAVQTAAAARFRASVVQVRGMKTVEVPSTGVCRLKRSELESPREPRLAACKEHIFSLPFR